jgi:hypothetical protein
MSRPSIFAEYTKPDFLCDGTHSLIDFLLARQSFQQLSGGNLGCPSSVRIRAATRELSKVAARSEKLKHHRLRVSEEFPRPCREQLREDQRKPCTFLGF